MLSLFLNVFLQKHPSESVFDLLDAKNGLRVFVLVGRMLRDFQNHFMDKVWQSFSKGDSLSKNLQIMHDLVRLVRYSLLG